MNKKRLLSIICRFPFINKIRLRGCVLKKGKDSCLFRSIIDCKGNNNSISISNNALLRNTVIHIRGNNNTVVIGNNTSIKDGEIWIEDSNNIVDIGENVSICGKTHIACIEGTRVRIGNDCLFSSDIVIRTGDSHSIFSENKRINISESVEIGDHVWVCAKVIILKGAHVANGCVVATGSVVTKKSFKPNSVIAGVPGVVKKESIIWDKRRI